VISVAERTRTVHGKNCFPSYRAVLEALGVPSAVMADLDYAVTLRGDGFGGLLETKWAKVDAEVLKNKNSRDRATLAEVLEDALADRDLQTLEELWQYVKGRYEYLRQDLDETESQQIREVLDL
jgi:hypothetical protein